MRTASLLWAIRPETVAAVVEILTGKASAQATHPTPKPSLKGRGSYKVAVIPIYGLLTNDGPYGSTYADIAGAVERAANDPDVKRVILSVDSPGGEVSGLPETATAIANLAKLKPVSAMVEGQAGSAAYWLASQAHDIACTPSGEVGSVGVRMMHVDMSAALDKAGLKVTELQAGEFKTEWSPFKALSDEAAEDMQTRLNSTHTDFIGAVASGRGRRASAAITKSRFGEGRMFSAKDAARHGLVDTLVSPRDFYRGLMTKAASEPFHSTAGSMTEFGYRTDCLARRVRLELERARIVH